MRSVHFFATVVAALGVVVSVWLATGCSREEPEAAPRIVRVAPDNPPPQGQGAPDGAAAQPNGGRPAPAGGEHEVGEHLLSAPADYIRTVTITAPRHARTSLNESLLTQSIQRYRAMNGEYPPSLDALAEWTGEALPQPPRGYKHSYDPKTGKVEVVPIGQ